MSRKCTKVIYKTQGKARNSAKGMSKKSGEPFDFYFCKKCNGWHVGHSAKAITAVEKIKLKENDAVIGIDPGINGALALICAGYLEIHDFRDIRTARNYISVLKSKFSIIFAIIEKVNIRPKERDVKRAEVLIRNAQIWETLLVLDGFDYELYPPQTWRKGLVAQSGSKERFIEKATELFPFYAKEFSRHDRAEAALIAYRAWRHIEAGKATRV